MYLRSINGSRKQFNIENVNNFYSTGGISITLFLLSKPQIAGQRLADQVPLVIRYQMMQESAVQLQREMLQMLQDKEGTEILLQEDSGIKTKRIHLQSRLNRLSKARILLTDFSMNIYNFSTTKLQGKPVF